VAQLPRCSDILPGDDFGRADTPGPELHVVDPAVGFVDLAEAGPAVAEGLDPPIIQEHLVVLEERARIARDLHDHVIQRLFGTGLGLVALAAIDPEHAEAIERHVAEIDAAIADIRNAVFTLVTRPYSTSARRRLLDVVTDLTPSLFAPPRIRFAGPIDLILTGRLADDVIAVVRESLTNVSRHARAGLAEVHVAVTEHEVTVTIDDDGVGLGKAGTRASGTASLAERARGHGGTFALVPRHTGGTSARWHVPLPPLSAVER
jgi:signal transduction histidine kinase